MPLMSHLRLVPQRPLRAGPASIEVNSADACLDAFRREFDYLIRSFRRLGVHRADVEDLAHEVFLVLNGRWNEYDPSRPLRPYLFGIAFRIASSHHRRTKRELPHAVMDCEDQAPRPDQVLQAKQARALVLGALERVPLPRRAVLIMHDIDEVPMRVIGSVLSIRLFTAYSRLRKARKEFATAVRSLRKVSDS